MANQLDSIFVDQSETAVATIGNSYLQNFLLNNKVEKGYGILTQKRFYFHGKLFGKRFSFSETKQGVVSIDDITFTEFIQVRSTGLLILGILLALVGLCVVLSGAEGAAAGLTITAAIVGTAVSFIKYFLTRQTLFQVSFAGGSFDFNIRYYPIADMRDFQRQLHLMKDHLKENG